jgi:hypothetical protein
MDISYPVINAGGLKNIASQIIMEIELDKRENRPTDNVPPDDIGKIEVVDDAEMEQFYGSSTTDAYRLKSELVSQCMADIGMGRCVIKSSPIRIRF